MRNASQSGKRSVACCWLVVSKRQSNVDDAGGGGDKRSLGKEWRGGKSAEDSRWEKDLNVVSQSRGCATAIGELAFGWRLPVLTGVKGV